jgi:hypothetical protein
VSQGGSKSHQLLARAASYGQEKGGQGAPHEFSLCHINTLPWFQLVVCSLMFICRFDRYPKDKIVKKIYIKNNNIATLHKI